MPEHWLSHAKTLISPYVHVCIFVCVTILYFSFLVLNYSFSDCLFLSQCKNGRTYSDAQTRVLMNDVATQHQPQSQTQSQPQPLLVIDGLLFHRIVVDQVPALDNRVYEVLFILASTNGNVDCVCVCVCVCLKPCYLFYSIRTRATVAEGDTCPQSSWQHTAGQDTC